jgi:PII-like signaling protein
MTPAPPVKLLVILVDETDTWNNELPLYEAIVRRLVQLEVSGATVSTGIMGFGSHQKVHRKRLFGVTDDRPVTILVADSEAKIRQILPVIRPMVPADEGLVLLLDAEVV